MSEIAVIDYGMGNLRSVSKALEAVADKQSVIVTSDADKIIKADRVVFPGVGAIRDCMSELHRLELDMVIRELCQLKPVLGICLGMQALLETSDENDHTQCLNIISGHVKRFELMKDAAGQRLKVPHMGWNQVSQIDGHPMWDGIEEASRFYFVHSYYVDIADHQCIAGETEYGVKFVSALKKENVFAVQFHPEKSQNAGLKLLSNFVNWCP